MNLKKQLKTHKQRIFHTKIQYEICGINYFPPLFIVLNLSQSTTGELNLLVKLVFSSIYHS